MRKQTLFGLFFALLMLPMYFTTAQVPNCPPADQNCDAWSGWLSRTWNLENPYCQITIDYRRRVCQPDNREELQYGNIRVTGNCQWMQNLSIYHYSINSLNELIDLLLIEDLENSGQYQNVTCPNLKTTRKFYTASCGIWVSCIYDISNTVPECEQGFDPPLPHFNDGDGDKVKYTKWQPCGQACCERVYQICRSASVTNPGSFVIHIMAMQRNRISPCTEQDKYDKPCQDGC